MESYASSNPGPGTQRLRPGPAADLPTGYSVVLPPGWQRIPIRQGTREAIREVTMLALGRLPRRISPDRAAPYRINIEQQLTQLARKARQAGGIDLYLPVEPVHGTPIPASFIVSCGTLPAPGPIDHATVVAHLMSAAGQATPVVVDDVAGVRIETTSAADRPHGLHVGSLRVDYVLPLPGRHDWWLIVTFSTPGDGDPDGEFAKLLTRLFDSIMLTFRWIADTVP